MMLNIDNNVLIIVPRPLAPCSEKREEGDINDFDKLSVLFERNIFNL